MLEGLERIYLTLPSGAASAIDREFDDGDINDGSFRTAGEGLEYKQFNYAKNKYSYPDLYYINLSAENIDEFVGGFADADLFSEDDLKLFFNADIPNALTLLSDEPIKNIAIPVDNKDLEDFVEIFGPLITSQDPYEEQQTKRGEGYTRVNLQFNGKATGEQLIAFHRYTVDLEKRVGSKDEIEMGVQLGSDYATLHQVAQAKLRQGFEEVNKTLVVSRYFDSGDPSSLMQISAERFDAYGVETKMKSIVGVEYYKTWLLQYDKGQVVDYATVAKLAEVDNHSLNFFMKAALDMDAQEQQVFQDAITHFQTNVSCCQFKFTDNETEFTIEAFLEPKSGFIEIKISAGGVPVLPDIEYEDESEPKTASDKLPDGTDHSKNIAQLSLLYFRQYLSTLESDTNLKVFDRQVII